MTNANFRSNSVYGLNGLAEDAINPIVARRSPTTGDLGYPVGQTWVNTLTNQAWIMTSSAGGAATWALSSPGASDVDTLTGDAGGAISPAGGTIILAGTAAQGISTSGGGNTITFTVANATTSQKGVMETATDSETRIGTSTAVATTPSNITALKSYTDITLRQSPVLESNLNTGVAPSGATGDVNLMMLQSGDIMEQFIIGAGQTIIAPRMTTTGLLVSLDLTATEGAEYNWGMRANSSHAFTIGTSAAFFLEFSFNVADVTGAEPILCGFRKQEANNGTYTNYTDYALIGLNNGVNPATIIIEDRLNSGVAVQTNTTDAWTDGQTHTLRINVSAAGVVTYLIDGLAPSVTHAFTFDNGDVVSPMFHLVHGAAAPGAINWVSVKCGLQ